MQGGLHHQIDETGGNHGIAVAVGAVTRHAHAALHTVIGLALLVPEQGGRRGEQRGLGNVRILPGFQLARATRSLVIGCRAVAHEQLTGEGLRHDAGHRIAIDGQARKRAPHRQA
ncbi:hypothetical protein BLX88_01265 [Bacillus obstructivus]|nr:hypothetical protein BLX88_01265 [Bacillus obstructivus]